MRVIIVPEDGSVSIDGVGRSPLDLSFMDAGIHAVQWYDTWGEVEHKDPVTGKMTANEEITDLAPFQPALDAWNAWVPPEVGPIPVTQP